MTDTTYARALDRRALFDSLLASDDLVLIQDLDGVCMGLVRDPLTRRVQRRYVDAAQRLAGHFYVLTNGEHVGRRGVNPIIDAALGGGDHGRYLPGLAAGGVQWQDAAGRVTHPGVSDRELAFLAEVPDKARVFLRECLRGIAPKAAGEDVIEACVLDNPASPTLNLNAAYRALGADGTRCRQVQREVADFMQRLLAEAATRGLGESFFVHYAPNLGRDEAGYERLKPVADGAGTTDFQLMLRGAVKEAGVLALLNRHIHARTGHLPFGADFNARQAPSDHAALLELARRHIDPAHMPRLVGVGDTVTSQCVDGRIWRGGSDRGFLTLVQDLGRAFDTDNRVIYVDSSDGEVNRPAVDAHRLPVEPWTALEGISDADDPLRLDAIFPGGHRQYVACFCAFAQAFAARA